MHASPAKTHRRGHRLAIGAAGLLAAGGLGLFAIAGATGALAQPNEVAASVDVGSTTTLALTTTSLPFAQPGSLPATEAGENNVAGSVNSNDPRGWTVDVGASSTPQSAGDGQYQDGDFYGASGSTTGGINDFIPISGLTVNGTALNEGSAFSGGIGSSGTAVAADTGSGSFTVNDAYSLTIPANTAADSFTTQLNYTIAGH